MRAHGLQAYNQCTWKTANLNANQHDLVGSGVSPLCGHSLELEHSYTLRARERVWNAGDSGRVICTAARLSARTGAL